MKPTLMWASVLLLFGSLASAPCVRADELVQVAPHRAGTPAEGTDTPPLFGYLARPQTDGPHSAVVILHGCSGFGPHYIAAAATLASWGYVALALDSLGKASMCEARFGPLLGSDAEAADAYGALRYLSAQAFVDPQRIVIMGYSMGGWAVLSAIENGPLEQSQPDHFRAAVAYYPLCGSHPGVMTAPTLILIGDRDDWTPAAYCQEMATHGGGEPVKLVIYPGATHAFDRQDLPPSFLATPSNMTRTPRRTP